MKRLLLSSLLSTSLLVIFAQSNYSYNSVKGTYEYNPYTQQNLMYNQMVRMNNFTNTVINNNMQSMMLFNNLMLNNAYTSSLNAESAKKLHEEGAKIIKAGKAKTGFVSSVTNTQALVKTFKWDATEPQDVPGQVKWMQDKISRFETMMKQMAYQPKDFGDAYALAFALSYEAYYNEKLGTSFLEQLRKDYKKELLSSTIFQATSDKEKQDTYEANIAMAVQAMDARNRWRAATDGSAKAVAEEEAKKYSAHMLQPKSLYHKGVHAIQGGKASTSFSRGNGIAYASYYTKEYNTTEAHLQELLKEFDAEVKKRGGQTNDAAWANAVAFAYAYEVYTEGKVKLNDKQLLWVLKEMQKDVLNMPSYQGQTDEEKSAYYQSVALKSILLYDQYRGKLTATKEQIKKGAEERVSEIFAPRNLSEYELTPNGFKPKTTAKTTTQHSGSGYSNLALPGIGALVAASAGVVWWRKRKKSLEV